MSQKSHLHVQKKALKKNLKPRFRWDKEDRIKNGV